MTPQQIEKVLNDDISKVDPEMLDLIMIYILSTVPLTNWSSYFRIVPTCDIYEPRGNVYVINDMELFRVFWTMSMYVYQPYRGRIFYDTKYIFL